MRQQPAQLSRRTLRVEWTSTARGYTVLRLKGDLDSTTVALLRQAIVDTPPETLAVIDMSEVPFLDSAGIGALIGGIRRLRERGGDVSVSSPRPAIKRVLHMTGFDRIVPVTNRVEEAFGAMTADTNPSPGGDRIVI